MTKAEAAGRIAELRKAIDKYRYDYHVLDRSDISDAALDSLKHELYKLEQEHPDLITADSPTQRVGGKALAKFQKVTHREPMLSMEDVFAPEEFAAWYQRLAKLAEREKFDVFCMPKVDGLALSIIYEDGLLKSAATRGDGKIGEDVTQNVKTVESVPLSLRHPKGVKIPKLVEVRGEVYMPVKDFEAYNKKMKKEGKDLLVNPRNASAGSIRQLDPKISAERPLQFIAWDLVTDLGQKRQHEEWELLREMGFKPAPESKPFKTAHEVETYWHGLQKRREKIGFWIDGMVIKVDDNALFDSLGVIGKTPRGLVAWKFPAEEATAVVRDIEWFVGRTGALTPVAVLDPTFIAGTTVTHATLHNFDEIERLGVRIGDTVILYKAGDIIPKVKQVLTDLRPKNAKATKPPAFCPVCNTKLVKREGEVAIICPNKRCPAQDREATLLAARAFDIDGLGPQTVAQMLEQGLIKNGTGLFTLTPEDLLKLEGFAEISSKKLIAAIHAKRHITLERFIVALGIRNVGSETAIDLAHHFGSIDTLMEASKAELLEVPNIGEIVADSIVEFFADKANRDLVADYRKNGIVIAKGEKRATSGAFVGKTVVLTGTLDSLSRDEAKDAVRAAGGNVAGSVSKKTDFVIAGAEPGSKFTDAQKLGVKILSEREFLSMIGRK